MSEQEMLVLSTKDRDRLKVLHEVRQGHLTQREAGEQLGFTDRWVRKLLGRVKGRKVEEVHVWRPRRSCPGELVQWDTSEHDWLEGRGPKLYLVAMIDDATSQAYARFVRQDSTEENLRVLGGYLKRRGRPV